MRAIDWTRRSSLSTWLITIAVPSATGVILGILIYAVRRKKAAGTDVDKEIERYAQKLGLDVRRAAVTAGWNDER